jgi:hypothetical protein
MNATMYTSGVDEHEYDDIDWILAMLEHKADFESSHQITTLSIPSMGESCSAVKSKSLSIYDADDDSIEGILAMLGHKADSESSHQVTTPSINHRGRYSTTDLGGRWT